MFKFKKIISMIMLVALLGSMLMSCGSKTTNNTPAPKDTTKPTAQPTGTAQPTVGPTTEVREADLTGIIPEETLTLNVYSQLSNYSGEQVGWFAKVILDKFNVKLNIINEGDGVFDTRVASGDLGDIVVFGNDTDQYQQAIKAGLLWEWNDEDLLTTYAPYINSQLQTALAKNQLISDGKTYGIGHNVATSSTEHEAFFYHPDIRWDLYKQLNYPEVNTLEDYIPLLEQMVKLAPTSDSGAKTYGASLFKDWDGDMVMFVKSTAALYGYDEFGFGLYNVNTQTYEPALQDGGMYLRCLKFYNSLYQKGLLDPDSMTQTFDDMSKAYQDGAAFFNIFSWMGSGLYNSQEHLDAGKAMLTLAAKDSKTLSYGCNVNGSNRLWTIGSKTQYPELCMAIINWLYTPEGTMTNFNGPKGITWDYDKDGKPYLTDLGLACKKDPSTELTGDYAGKYSDGGNQMNNSTWSLDATNPDGSGSTYNYSFWDSYLAQKQTDIQEDWKSFTGSTVADQYLEKVGFSVAKGSTYTATTKSDELKITWNQVAECIKEYSWKAIYAKDDAEFNAIVAELKTKADGYGYQDCVKFQENEAALRKAAEDKVK